MNTRQEIALAVGRGWTFLPCVRAERDGTVLIGSDNADLLPRIVEFEREDTAHKEGVAEREHIDFLLRRIRALADEPSPAKGAYDQLIETLKELMAQPREILLAHEDFVAWHERVKRRLEELDA